MEAFELVAYDMDGARYCLDCARKAGIDVDADKSASGYGGPVFASDLEGAEYCGECHNLIFGEEEEEEPSEPEEGDITTHDEKHWLQHGKPYFTGDREGLKAKMDADKFWPNVWVISDHGNACLITL